MATVNLGRIGFVHKGDYVGGNTEYKLNDVVVYNNSVYVCIQPHNTEHLPTDTAYWKLWIGVADFARVNGDNTQRFKVADAVNPDEALSKGQLLSEIQAIDGSGSGLDADTVDGFEVSQTPTPNTIPIADANGYLNAWIDTNSLNTSNIVESTTDPTITENLSKGTIWVNNTSGEVFVCIDDTTDKNIWQGQLGTNIKYITTNIVDIFGDGSCIALYQLDGNANDTGGLYNGIANNVTYDTGKFGQAVKFSSAYSFIKIDGFTQKSGKEPITVSGWVKLTSNNARAVLFNGAVNNNGDRYNFSIDANKIFFSVYQGTNLSYNTTINLNQWYHICITSDSNGRKIYLDGNLVASDNVSFLNDATDDVSFIYIGNDIYGVYHNINYGSKNIDQVRIFNRALTDSEVQQLYNEK